MGSGTALVVGLFFLPAWGFWRVAVVALLIQLPPNLLIHSVSSSVPSDFFVKDEQQERTDERHSGGWRSTQASTALCRSKRVAH